MELKEFIKNSITAIADATSELQNELEEEDIIINPPVSAFLEREDVVELGAAYTGRRVKNVNFDVAISSETTKEGGTRMQNSMVKLKIYQVVSHAFIFLFQYRYLRLKWNRTI